MKKTFQLSVVAIALAASGSAMASHVLATDVDHITINVNTDDGNIGDFIVQNGTNNPVETFRSNKHFTNISTSNGNTFKIDNNGASLSDINLSGVADAVQAQDAVNLRQLQVVESKADAAATAAGNVLADAKAYTDASSANVLNQANAYTDASSANVLNQANAYTDAVENAAATDRAAIRTEFTAADAKLQANIDAEAKTRADADIKLQASIDAEAATRAAADNKLQANIDAEAKTRADADIKLQANIDTEAAARIEGDKQTLAAANTYTDQRVNKLEKRSNAAIAASIAIASLPQPTEAGKSMLSFGTGAWESEQGYAVGVSGVTTDNKWVYKAAGSGSSRGKFGGGLSVGYQW